MCILQEPVHLCWTSLVSPSRVFPGTRSPAPSAPTTREKQEFVFLLSPLSVGRCESSSKLRGTLVRLKTLGLCLLERFRFSTLDNLRSAFDSSWSYFSSLVRACSKISFLCEQMLQLFSLQLGPLSKTVWYSVTVKQTKQRFVHSPCSIQPSN